MKPLQFAYSPRCPYPTKPHYKFFFLRYAFICKATKTVLCGIALRNRLRQLKCNLYETFEENLHHCRLYTITLPLVKRCCIVIDGARAPFRDYDNLKVNISSHFSEAKQRVIIFFFCLFANKIEEDWWWNICFYFCFHKFREVNRAKSNECYCHYRMYRFTWLMLLHMRCEHIYDVIAAVMSAG